MPKPISKTALPRLRKGKNRILYDREEMIADWKTGKYTLDELGHKHKVSKSTAHNVTRGIEKTLGQLIDKEIAIKQEVMHLSGKEYELFHKEVDLRTKHLQLLYDSTHKNVSLMMKKFDNQKRADKFSMDDHKTVQQTLKDARTTLLGNEPAVSIQNNNNVNQSPLRSMTPEEIREELAKADAILGEYTSVNS